MNINILEESNPKIDIYKIILANSGFESFVNVPTRSTSNACLDYVSIRVSDKNKSNIEVNLNHADITDHTMIVVIFL